MAIRQDEQGTEIRHLLELVEDFAGKSVLEVGCGAGRLTWRYAGSAARVVGIDHNADEIARAAAEVPPALQDRVEFLARSVLDYEPVGEVPFDLAILSWSL